MSEDDDAQWHLDKKVPLALIGMMVAQTLAFGWWAGGTTERLAALERRAESTAPQAERLVRLETKVDGLSDGLKEVKALLQKTATP